MGIKGYSKGTTPTAQKGACFNCRKSDTGTTSIPASRKSPLDPVLKRNNQATQIGNVLSSKGSGETPRPIIALYEED